MASFMGIFVNIILPAFLVIGAGAILGRWLQVDKRSISRMAIYVLTPCLILSSVVESTLPTEAFGKMILYVAVLTVVLCVLAFTVGKLLRWPSRTIDGLVLSVAFTNAGNFGLSMILLAYGQPGVELASVYFVASNLAGTTLSAFFAARSKKGGWRALLQVFKLPGLYAFILAILLRALQLVLPAPINSAVSLIGRGSVPVMLMLLGMQLAQTHLGGRYGQVAIGVVLRLVVGALLAIGLAPIIGLSGLARNVAIAEASTPTAVTSALMAIEFEGDAEYVTSVIFFTTLLSALTLTIVLWYLG
ncbi:MAG: AEC family transporter [Anaerolineae bacterium]